MAQKKKKAAGKGRSSRKNTGWESRREHMPVRLIAVIVLAGLLAAALGFYVQSNGLLVVKTDESVASNTVFLNELMTDNIAAMVTETGDVPDWIEIANTGSESVNVGKYSLLLDANINRMFTFPEYVLMPGEYLLVYAEGMDVPASMRGEWSAPFKLSPSGGETLVLMNAQGKAVDMVEIPELEPDVSYRKGADGQWGEGGATPGADNDSAGGAGIYQESGVHLVEGALEVTEVMTYNTLYFADENGEYHDYVEVHNKSGENVNLEGWYLSDSSDKLKRWSFPAVILPPDGYVVVHCSGYNRKTDAYHLHTDFKIGSDGENIYLSQPDGHTVSMVDTPALTVDQAYTLTESGWSTEIAPTPGLSNTMSSAAQMHTNVFGDRSRDVYISEVMASAVDQLYDWVEIYNGSAQAVDLSDYGLSDSPDKPRKWQFPQGTVIQPGQYMGIYLSGVEQSSMNGFLNADFAVSALGGSTITLSNPDGSVLDAIYLPKQYSGSSYGRVQGQNGTFYFETGTPGLANNAVNYRSRADMAQPSVVGGLFKTGDSFTVSLNAPAGSRIYYTLDSSDPTESATLYTGPIQVSGTTILRTKVYRDGCMPSLTDTQSYLYDVQTNDDIYIISLVSDKKNLQGESGILTNYMELWEKEAHFELFTPEGERVLGQGCGISLHGQDSRRMPVKTFNVIARNQYSGTNRFNYPIFSDRDYDSYQSFLLRSSGEDYCMSFMRDSVLSSLMEDTSVLYQKCEVAVIYLDGQYYTLTYIRERMNTYAVCQFENWEGMEDDLDLIKGNDSVKQGSDASFKEMISWLKSNDFSTQAAYDYIDSHIDVQNYIEYMALQIFVGNTDTLNVKRYRNVKADGKWRWILFDLDWAFFNDTDSIGKWLTPGGTGAGKRTDNTLFIACMRNPIFFDKFMTYFGEQMATTFSTKNVLAKMGAHYAKIEPALPQYTAQWGISLDGGIKKVIRYAEERPNKLLNTYFRDALKMSDADMQKYFGDALDEIERYEKEKGGM